jgi:hypothetical protein
MAEDNYELKRTTFHGQAVTILLQGANGPCPLLAISNILLLRGQISIHEDMASVSFSHLVDLVANRLLESNPPSPTESEADAANRTEQLGDAISLLPVLSRGLDVNVQFSPGSHSRNPCLGFEYTRELTPLDMLNIDLCHGWLADPQDTVATKVLAGRTYNHCVEILVAFRSLVGSPVKTAPVLEPEAETSMSYNSVVSVSSDDASGASATPPAFSTPVPPSHSGESPVGEATPSPVASAGGSPGASPPRDSSLLIHEGGVVESFMEATATQLTYFGLVQLHSHVSEGQLVIFFRANHFNVMVKHAEKLYLLVTDEGYREEREVVWELLDGIDGDTEYFNDRFGRPAIAPASPGPVALLPANLMDPDFLLAVQLQGGTSPRQTPASAPASTVQPTRPSVVATTPLQLLPVLEGRQVDATGGVRIAQACNVQVVTTVTAPEQLGHLTDFHTDDVDYAQALQRQIDREAGGTGRVAGGSDAQFALALQQQLDLEEQGAGRTQARAPAAERRRQHEAAAAARAAAASKSEGGGCAIQ